MASVELTENPQTSISRVNGEPALAISVTKLPAANTVEVSNAVRDALPDLQSALDTTNPGAEFTVVFDQAPYIEKSIESLAVEGLLGWDGGRGQTIRYIDWDTPANNRFTVINQYRVDCPPGFTRGKAFIVPDLVLLVNGIPLVVVECKSPAIPEALDSPVEPVPVPKPTGASEPEGEAASGGRTAWPSGAMRPIRSATTAAVGRAVGSASVISRTSVTNSAGTSGRMRSRGGLSAARSRLESR